MMIVLQFCSIDFETGLLFDAGLVLGLAYAQTRTLSTPIFIHALWNSGVVILLTILRVSESST